MMTFHTPYMSTIAESLSGPLQNLLLLSEVLGSYTGSIFFVKNWKEMWCENALKFHMLKNILNFYVQLWLCEIDIFIPYL